MARSPARSSGRPCWSRQRPGRAQHPARDLSGHRSRGSELPARAVHAGLGDDLQGQCGGAGSEDRAYHWVAPADGLYYFRATSSSFTPVISLIDGPRCSDRVIACNPAVNREYGAEAVRFLRAGQAVSVVVDGRDGAGLFTLDIGLEASQMCPEAMTLMAGAPFSDDFAGPTLSSSCGPTRSTGFFGELYEVPDKVYPFEVFGLGPGCGGGCDIVVRAPQSFTLYALEGADCGGAEVACHVADVDQASGTATTTLSLEAGAEAATYTIVVADRFANDPGTGFTIEAQCYAIC